MIGYEFIIFSYLSYILAFSIFVFNIMARFICQNHMEALDDKCSRKNEDTYDPFFTYHPKSVVTLVLSQRNNLFGQSFSFVAIVADIRS